MKAVSNNVTEMLENYLGAAYTKADPIYFMIRGTIELIPIRSMIHNDIED